MGDEAVFLTRIESGRGAVLALFWMVDPLWSRLIP